MPPAAVYRIVWTPTSATIGYIFQIGRVVSGTDLTFWFDAQNRLSLETETANVSFVQVL